VTDFKEGDKIKWKEFRNKKDYDSQCRNIPCCPYEEFIYRTKYMNGIYTIKYFDDDGSIAVNGLFTIHFWPFQIEKVYSLKDRLTLARELIK
jgi:hypothetical protein